MVTITLSMSMLIASLVSLI
ncbi:Protein of unknown function [Streptococcus thermophilus]|nr:Protein of unknown function [Streptococcus thermophilus]